MRLSIMLLLVLPFNTFAQHIFLHQSTADSLVTYFLGAQIFQQYVAPDLKQSHQTNENTFFQYNFRHPSFSGETFIIAFTLDSKGHFIPGKEARGIIKTDSANDNRWVDARTALATCRNQGQVKKKTLRLAWDNTSFSFDDYLKTGNLKDISPGRLVWQVDGKVDFRGDKYSGTFEVDVLTGRVFRKFAIPWD